MDFRGVKPDSPPPRPGRAAGPRAASSLAWLPAAG